MAYACGCNNFAGYSGFFDEFLKISEVALPTVGGLQGLQAGYNDGDILGGLLGGLKGVTTGYQQVAQLKQPVVQTVPPTARPASGVSMPVVYDSLLGGLPLVATQTPVTSPAGMTPQQIAAQHAAQLQALYNAEQAKTSSTTNKMLLYGGLGVGALVLLLIATR